MAQLEGSQTTNFESHTVDWLWKYNRQDVYKKTNTLTYKWENIHCFASLCSNVRSTMYLKSNVFYLFLFFYFYYIQFSSFIFKLIGSFYYTWRQLFSLFNFICLHWNALLVTLHSQNFFLCTESVKTFLCISRTEISTAFHPVFPVLIRNRRHNSFVYTETHIQMHFHHPLLMKTFQTEFRLLFIHM